MPDPNNHDLSNAVRQAINQAVFPLLFPVVMVRQGLDMIKPSLVLPTERATVETGSQDIGKALDLLDNRIAETVTATLKAVSVASAILDKVPADVRVAIEAGIKAGAKGIVATQIMAAAGEAKVARDVLGRGMSQ